MYDAALFYRERASTESSILSDLGLTKQGYVLATCHRAENTDDINRLKPILESFAHIANDLPLVLPLHPRTKKLIEVYQLSSLLSDVIITAPLSFIDMVALEQEASFILTDSGGVQKEAYFYQVPCITMREETEWIETLELGWNQLVGADKTRIIRSVQYIKNRVGNQVKNQNPYGSGIAASKICKYLMNI
jgi:UDP-GlcNAc3NAcA epimerase